MRLYVGHSKIYVNISTLSLSAFPGYVKNGVWLMFCFWLSAGVCISQRNDNSASPYTITHFTDENGLPQNSVKGIGQGADGYIWLTTENGLVRFDGRHFYIFDKSNVKIESNRISAFRRSFNPLEEKFYAQVSNDSSFIIQNGKVETGKNDDTEKIKILFSEKDQLKVYVTNGLPSYFGDTFSPKTYIIPHRNGDFFACYKNKVEYFHSWKKKRTQKIDIDRPWDLFKLGQYLFLSSANGSFKRIGGIEKSDGAIGNLFLNGDITANQGYSEGQRKFKIFWNVFSGDVFLYLNKSLYLLQDNGDNALNTKLILSDFDFEINYIATVHYDKNYKRVFLGSATKGLFVVTYNDFRTLTVNKNPQDNVFYAQIPISENTVLLQMNRVLGITGPSDHVVSYILNKEIENHSVANNSLLKDKDGFIWLKSFFKVLKYDKKGKTKLTQWDFPGKWITRLHEGTRGQIWIGTNDSGLYYINRGEMKVHSLLKKSIKLVTYLHHETDDLLWVGTEKGLYRIQISKQKAELVKGLERVHIRSLYITAPGQIWITTHENGFFLYDKGTLVKFPLDKNRYLSASHSITEDRNGFFWIPTNKGLFQVSKEDLLKYASNKNSEGIFYLYYDKSNGFNTNEFNGGCQPCAVRLANDYVSLPSLEGLVWFKPEKVVPEVPDAKIKLDRVEIGDKVIPSNTALIQLPFKALQVKLYFSTPYFGHRENLNLFYCLAEEGNSESLKWFPLNNEEMIVHLSNLSSGSHTVMVRKANGFGLNNYSYKTIKIIVPFPWYSTWWFRLLVALLLLTLIYGYFRHRIKSIETKNRILEDKVADRTQKLEQAIVVMSQSQVEVSHQIYIQSRIIASITHDFRTPMNSIIYSSGKIEGMIEASQYSQIVEVSTSIKDTSIGIKELLNNLLEYIGPQVHHKSVQKDFVVLSDVVSHKFGLLNISQRGHPNTFINEIPSEVVVNTNYNLLGIILHNLIDNANKYTYKGIVNVSAENSENDLHLMIRDTGTGIASDLQHWLNSSTAEIPQNADQMKEKGLGLIIVKEVTQLLGLQLKVKSDSGGSEFRLTFKNHAVTS